MNTFTTTESSALAMQTAERVFQAIPFRTSEQISAEFVHQINLGNIRPAQMADVIYAMNNYLVDSYENVALWMPKGLEEVADDLLKAVDLADIGEQA